MNKRKQPPAPKDPVSNKRKSPPPVDAAERSYQTIAVACREIRAREREREALIQEVCKRLRNVQPDGLLEAIDDLCCAPLLEECPQHHGHKGDPGVTPRTCGAIGERAQVILVWVRAPGRWEPLPPTETRSHEG